MKHYQTKTLASINHDGEAPRRATNRVARLMVGVMSSLLLVSIAVAADRDDNNTRSRYEQERAMCNNGASNQSRETCLREAAAARQVARSGGLTTENEEQLRRNRERRCEVHTSAEEREYCLQRMRGEGSQSGDVQRGGILRELKITVVPKQ